MADVKYIIVQAGGKGTRLNHLTVNKPKALVSVNGAAILINTMRLYPNAKFLIIADYKNEVLEKYLKLFTPSSYKIIRSKEKGTSSGVSDAIKYIPPKEPFLIIWCDLFFQKKIIPAGLKIDKNKNYMGLSKNFRCRWSFKDNLAEKPSIKNGVAGVYFFKNKKEIEHISDGEEFCLFLKDNKISFDSFYLDGVLDIGDMTAYLKAQRNFNNSRPFNEVILEGNKAIKKAKDSQGLDLAAKEKAWYKKVEKFNYSFIPKIYFYDPLTMQRIDGKALAGLDLAKKEKKLILKTLIENIKELHSSYKPKQGDFLEDNKNAYLSKTKDRLDKIASLIPDINKDKIKVNGQECLNIYKHWNLLKKEVEPYFSNEYKFIHGDPTFSNTMLENRTNKAYLIDPRGYFGSVKYFGDPDYDWAKLYYSVVGNYDQFNRGNFALTINDNENLVEIKDNGWRSLEKYFFELTGADENKIRLIHSIIWLSLTTYVWDNYDSILSSFYLGLYYFNEYVKNKNQKPA